jgi:starch synthase
MKILFVASEVVPLAKVGGLGDVIGSLPKALNALGHDARVLIPQYNSIDFEHYPPAPVLPGFRFPLLGEPQVVNLNLIMVNGLPIYTLENQKYFGGREVYTGGLDLERFFFFSRAVFELLRHLDWQPDIIHCHDWMTALLVMWLRKAGYPCRSVFTIHNLAYQGVFDAAFLTSHDLQKNWDDYPPDAPPPPLNFLSQAILCADLITTVSPTYAREITTPAYGAGLEALLSYRQSSLLGILNGLDYSEWDPLTDPHLPVNYGPAEVRKKAFNKIALQRVAGLPVSSTVPLIGMVQRLDGQKGFDILEKALEPLMLETDVQFVILGRGWDNYEAMLKSFAARFPNRLAVFIAFENSLAHLIYSGSDLFLMPSRFEPCGLGQMIAMRYGALPIVRHTGGLVDTVPAFSPDLTRGRGFVFHDYSAEALIEAVQQAAVAFRNKVLWQAAMQRVAGLDLSWGPSAAQFESAYRRALETRALAKPLD